MKYASTFAAALVLSGCTHSNAKPLPPAPVIVSPAPTQAEQEAKKLEAARASNVGKNELQ